MATWEECNQEIEKITPPPSDGTLERLLSAIGYEEQEVKIDGNSMTILVKKNGSE